MKVKFYLNQKKIQPKSIKMKNEIKNIFKKLNIQIFISYQYRERIVHQLSWFHLDCDRPESERGTVKYIILLYKYINYYI